MSGTTSEDDLQSILSSFEKQDSHKMVNRDFKGIWIAKEIWLNKKLSIMEKCFLVEIDSLDNKDGCYASNAYFADFFDISKSRCSQIMSSLEEKGFIKIELKMKGNQVTGRVVNILNRYLIFSTGYLENCAYSNTSNNKEKKDAVSPANDVSVLGPNFNSVSKSNPDPYQSLDINKPAQKTLFESSAQSTVTKVDIDQRKLDKIYLKVLDRLKNLTELKIIPAIRKITETREKLIKARIKEELSLPFWNEVFDRIEQDADIYRKLEWFDVERMFRKDRSFQILEGNFDWAKNKDEQNSGSIKDPPFKSPKNIALLEKLISMVSDNVKPGSDKEDSLVEIINQILDWSEPCERLIQGQKARGYVNYQTCFGRNVHEIYPYYVENYAKRTGMPIAVSMITEGSECWKAFDADVTGYWTYMNRDQYEAAIAED